MPADCAQAALGQGRRLRGGIGTGHYFGLIHPGLDACMSDPPAETRRVRCLAIAILMALAALAGCRKHESGVVRPETGEPTPEETARALEDLTEKAPVKLVWIEGDRLFGFDSFQPTEPVLLREANGLERPLLTPDGGAVIFTEAGKIHQLTWPAKEDRALADGVAIATLRDPDTKQDWVYAATTAATVGQKVFRFRLPQPHVREAVWDKSPVAPGSAQVSRDGRRLSGRFAGVDSGLADLGLGRWEKVAGSRPLALAPDLSHLLAMLDGTGRRLRFFHPSGTPWDPMSETLVPPASWQAHLPSAFAPELRFTDLRWTNHSRFVVLSASRHPRGRLAMARLARDGRLIEKVVPLATAGSEPRSADAWVAGGEASRPRRVAAVARAVDSARSGRGRELAEVAAVVRERRLPLEQRSRGQPTARSRRSMPGDAARIGALRQCRRHAV